MESDINIEEPVQQKVNVSSSPAIQYSNELKEDLHLTISNLREKALTASSMKAKWIGYMAKEKEALAKLIQLKNDHQKNLMAKSKTGNAFDKLKQLNQDDPVMKKIDSTRKDVELSLEVIAQAITALSEFGYNVKNSIDIIKLNG